MWGSTQILSCRCWCTPQHGTFRHHQQKTICFLVPSFPERFVVCQWWLEEQLDFTEAKELLRRSLSETRGDKANWNLSWPRSNAQNDAAPPGRAPGINSTGATCCNYQTYLNMEMMEMYRYKMNQWNIVFNWKTWRKMVGHGISPALTVADGILGRWTPAWLSMTPGG